MRSNTSNKFKENSIINRNYNPGSLNLRKKILNGKMLSKTIDSRKPFNSMNKPSNENLNHIRPDIVDNNIKIAYHSQI